MRNSKFFLSAVVALWAIAAGTGFVWVTDYAARPNQSIENPLTLPYAILEKRENTLPALFVFIHPQCGCSRATLNELARLTARYRNSIDVRVFFYLPQDKPENWAHTELWQQAVTIPSVTVAVIGETDLKKIGALTSGQSLLYNAYGQLLFSGGITPARGHEGDNLGRNTIEEYLQTGKTKTFHTPVFGCILTAPE